MQTSDQLRAARALIRWDQKILAQRSGVSVPTIKRLEAQSGILSANVPTLAAVRRALESAGVIFVAENGEGAGVRLRKHSIQSAPPENDLVVEFDQNSGECFATCDGARKFMGVFETRELAETAAEEYQRELDWHKAKLEHPKG
ncbi:helix-turn-helix domain-containing protein [Labrys okinawensis]|uniref:helix-turn-helix domain-containing protein n=1 Tax=Labrys okinawensis TaxID=346911 RepID=UPI0039BCC5B0